MQILENYIILSTKIGTGGGEGFGGVVGWQETLLRSVSLFTAIPIP